MKLTKEVKKNMMIETKKPKNPNGNKNNKNSQCDAKKRTCEERSKSSKEEINLYLF